MKRTIAAAALLLGFTMLAHAQQNNAASVPKQPAASSSGSLPAGHPDLAQIQKSATRPAITGTLGIRAVQGTANGPAVAGDAFTAEFYVQQQLLDRVEGKLDVNGTASISGIPLNLNPQALVKITHAGVEYQASGSAMDGSAPQAILEVPVYETTEKAPDWQVRMRHVMVEHGGEGLQVMEMLAIDNPSDRAWIGTPGKDGERATFSFALPVGAGQIKLVSGASEVRAELAGNTLSCLEPLPPGNTEYQVSYVLPVKEGRARLSVVCPVLVKRLLVFIPNDGTKVQAQGLEAGGIAGEEGSQKRFFQAAAVPAGREIDVEISGIPAENASSGGAASAIASGSIQAARIIAGAGALVIVLFGAALLLMKPRPKKA